MRKNRDIAYEPLPVERPFNGTREFRKAVILLRETLDDQKEYQSLRAQIMRRLYDELIAQNFKPEDALQITIMKSF